MCMRMGSDAGRDFLSTKDPVKKETRSDEFDAADNAPKVERPANFASLLEQYFMGRTSK
jgi:hypothetical protein